MITMNHKMPYFDYLLKALKKGHAPLEKSFGQHVHWGYWQTPKQASLTTEDFSLAAENLSQLLCNAAHITHNQAILDVGCGFGGTIALINENYQNMDLIGVNIDERQLERARQYVKPIGDNRINFQQGDACLLPFEDNSFDVVLAVECIFHFSSREQFFKEAYRVLKPNGYLALSDFLLSKKLLKLHNLKTTQYLSNGFFGRCNVQYNPEKYHQLAKQIQFRVDFERDITKNTLPTYTYLKKLIKNSELYRSNRFISFSIMLTISCIELLSKVGGLKYGIFAFKK